MWPMLVDMNKDDCRRVLRSLELETYGNVVSVLRAQGCLGPEKKKLLQELATAFNIPIERHKAEVRKAVNDEKLNTIAETLFGPNTATEWAIEGRRLVPLIPRQPPKTAYSLIADQAANMLAFENSQLLPPSETASKASESYVIAEPASPEPSKTQVRSQSPGAVVMLSTGTPIPIKRESEEDHHPSKRARSCSQVESPLSPQFKNTSQVPMTSRTLSFPSNSSTPLKIALPTTTRYITSTSGNASNNPKVIIVSSAPSSGTSSILQKTLSVPIKSVASNIQSSKASVIYTQSLPQQISSSSPGVQTHESGSYVVTNPKLRTKSMIGSVQKPRTGAIVVSNQSPQGLVVKNQSKPGTPSTPLNTGGAPHLKTALQTTKHTIPIQSISGLQLKSQTGERTPQTKILVQQKAIPRGTAVAKSVQSKNIGTLKGLHSGMLPKTSNVVVQQKAGSSGKPNVVQLKPGFSSLPIQIRATKQPSVQIKSDTPGVKMVAITAGTKILPKPSQPMYMVAASSAGLSVVTRTITSSSSPRLMTVSTPSGSQIRNTQSNIFSTSKPLHMMTQQPRTKNLVLVQKQGKGSPLTPGKDMFGKVLTRSGQSGVATITVQKPQTGISSSALSESLQSLPVTQTQSGNNVILLDLSNPESMTKNAAIAELLQASGFLNSDNIIDTKSKVTPTEENIKTETHEEEQEDTEVKTKPAPAGPVLSIEEAVEMLNQCDTPETRAILSKAGIQISDEIADSEEEEPDINSSQQVPKKVEEKKEVEPEAAPVEKKTTYTPSVSIPLTTTPRTMDIFSTALASANINLDNFMEEEDEPDQSSATEASTSATDTTLNESKKTDIAEPESQVDENKSSKTEI